MFLIEIQEKFTAVHAVQMPDGQWEAPHSHSWQLRIFLTRNDLNKYHMVVDFHHAKQLLRTIIDPMEGRDLNDIDAIGPSATAELLARYIFEKFDELLVPAGVRVKSLALCESENCWAWYTGNGR
jgi:6-pyruvoyl-tetrahydropterin synthase